MARHKAYFERELAAAWDEYTEKVRRLAKQARDMVVKPACEAKGLRFRSGMGTWALGNDSVSVLREEDAKDVGVVRVVQVIDVEVPGNMGTLGEWIADIG